MQQLDHLEAMKNFATGPQTQMEAQFGQLLRDGDGTLTGKYDVGRGMEESYWQAYRKRITEFNYGKTIFI
jgi:hypothetical protein